MPTTPHERAQELVDMEAEQLQEYIETNGHELYQFFMDNLESLESVCNLMVKHFGDNNAWTYIRHRIRNEIKSESYDKARERIYG